MPSRAPVNRKNSLVDWLRQALSENLALKAMALVFALGFFGYLHGQEDIQQRTIPIGVISLPPEEGAKELMTRIPASIHVTVRGPTRAMTSLIQDGVTPIEVDLRQGYPERVAFQEDTFSIPHDLEVVLVDPPYLDLEWEEVVTRQVPLQSSISGQPAEGRMVKGEPKVDPEKVTVRGPISLVETMQFARLSPYVVTGLTEGTWARRIAIDPPQQRVRLLGSPAATVTVEVVRRKSEKLFAQREVEVLGPAYAVAVPNKVDVTVIGPPEVVANLRAEQIVPRADLAAAGEWTLDAPHGSASVPITVPLNKVEAEVQPPSVTVKW